MLNVGTIKTFGATPTGLTAVDSITTGDGSVFVEYGNGADSTGLGGSSTIIQYDKSGNVEFTYQIAGALGSMTAYLAARAGNVLALAGTPATPPEAVGHASPEAFCDALLRHEGPITVSGDQALLSAVIGALSTALLA